MKFFSYYVGAGNPAVLDASYIRDTDFSASDKSTWPGAWDMHFGSTSDAVFPGDKVFFEPDGSGGQRVVRIERTDHSEHILADSTGQGEHQNRADLLDMSCHTVDGHAGGPAQKRSAAASFKAQMKRSAHSVLAVALKEKMKLVAGTDNRDALKASNDALAKGAAKAFFAGAEDSRTYAQLLEFAAELKTLNGSVFLDHTRNTDDVSAMVIIQRRLDGLKRGWSDLGLTPAASARLRILTAAGEVDSGYDEVAVAANAEHLVMLSPLVNGKFVELRPGNDRLTTFAYSDSGDPEIVEATTLPSGESVEFAYETSTTFDPATATWSAEAPLFSANARRIIVRLAAQEESE